MIKRSGFVGIALLGTFVVLAMADPAEAQLRGRRSRGMEPAYAPPPQQQPPTAEAAAPMQQQVVQYNRRGRRGRVVSTTAAQPPSTMAPTDQSRYSFYPSNIAQIQLRLPNPNAEVRFDGQTTRQKGAMRMFTTPPLDGNYTYQVTAVWQQPDGQRVTRERTISVRPGAQVTVDFTTERPTPNP